jgi:hypothetical protein
LWAGALFFEQIPCEQSHSPTVKPEIGRAAVPVHSGDMKDRGVTRVQGGIAQAIDWTYVSPARKVGRPRGRLLRRIANALGLFSLARDVSLEVESVSAQRRRDVALARFWSDGGDAGS